MFSVEHPLFKYSPNTNPYWEKIRISSAILEKGPWIWTDHDVESKKGQWKTLAEGRPITLEIGCNGGHFLNPKAASDPSTFYVGIDWKFKQAFLGYEKAHKRGVSNVAYIRGHAERLGYIFEPGEIHRILVYFPDPWPKRSQTRNRLLQKRWFEKAHALLAPGGQIEIKTDHADYFEFILSEVQTVSKLWQIESVERDIHCENPDAQKLLPPDVTLFEQVFIREGLPVYRLKLSITR